MKPKASTTFFKRFTGFLHVVFACITLIGIGFMYLNNNYGRGLDWINNESFEQSPDFTKKIQNDISNIFNYIKYRSYFETNGEIDYNKLVLEVTTGPGGEKSYTLNDIILYGKELGYYMDEANDYALQGPYEDLELSEEDNARVYVQWRCYQSTDELTGPDQSYETLPNLTYELLKRYSAYYSIHSRLMSDFTNLYFRVAYYSKNDAIYQIHTNAPEMSIDDMMAMGKYLYYEGDSNDLVVRTNLDSTFPSIPTLVAQNNPYNSNKNYVIIGLDTSYTAKDDYYQACNSYTHSRSTFVYGIYLTIAGLSGSLLTFFILLFLSGHQSTNPKGISVYPLDKIKTDIFLLFMLFITYLGVIIGAPMLSKLLHLIIESSYWERGNRMVTFGVIYFCALLTFFSLVRRYKAETLWTNSFLHDLTLALSDNTFKYRLTISYILYLSYNVFIITIGAFFVLNRGNEAFHSMLFVIGMIVWIVGNLMVFYYLYRNANQTDLIHQAIEKLAAGETSYKVDISDFSSLEASLAEGLNRISDGLETALAEQVKSERLKADLITNVSHDIKTPLTSIINYVDLIKREKIENPTVQRYLEVLDQKSQRLKTLTEDLVEASKASSGNIKLEMNQIDLIELVQQTNGEFEEKYAMRKLEMVNSLPNEVILIEADGRRLWRVLENLYNNACKYALENTRVYISVEDRGNDVVFSIKNISAAPLNISPDELTERFVRGDVSRTTEGSGLGLSIAKSLTQLQGGTFQITIDGDLFKAEIAFAIKN